jgi:hypothetical protein
MSPTCSRTRSAAPAVAIALAMLAGPTAPAAAASGPGNPALADLAAERGRKFFAGDFGCAPNVELSDSDFFSPCLVEAAFVGEIVNPTDFAAWLDRFMPAPDSAAFKSLLTVNMEMPGTAEELKSADMLGAKAHLVGLGVSRARALEDVAGALPPSDPRVAIYRQARPWHS